MDTINLTTLCDNGEIKFIFVQDTDDSSQSNMEKVMAVSLINIQN